MKKSKIAGLVLASLLAVTPTALAGGLGDMNLPDGYASTERSPARGWYIAPKWGYPFSFAIFNR